MMQIGLGNRINHNKITVVAAYGSMPITREIQTARNENRLIDCTHGRRTRSVIFLDSGQIVLSSITPENLGGRWNAESNENPDKR